MLEERPPDLPERPVERELLLRELPERLPEPELLRVPELLLPEVRELPDEDLPELLPDLEELPVERELLLRPAEELRPELLPERLEDELLLPDPLVNLPSESRLCSPEREELLLEP